MCAVEAFLNFSYRSGREAFGFRAVRGAEADFNRFPFRLILQRLRHGRTDEETPRFRELAKLWNVVVLLLASDMAGSNSSPDYDYGAFHTLFWRSQPDPAGKRR